MKQSFLLQKLAIAGVVGAIGVIGVQAGAQAAQIYEIPRGEFITEFFGDKFAVFGDTVTAIPPCPLCDSTVSSTAYRTLGDDDWTNDQPLIDRGFNINPTFLEGMDLEAEWVFLYQVVNTDPLTANEGLLQQLNVTKTDKNGNPFPEQPYTSGGFYDGLVFENASTAINPLDVPNDWNAEDVPDLGNAILGPISTVNPSFLQLPPAGSFQITNNTVKPPGVGYDGALFTFGAPPIDLDGTSSILFLTTDENSTGIIWAETQSGGDGAAGDVYGVKNKVPEPGTVLGLLAVGGLGLGMKRKKEQK